MTGSTIGLAAAAVLCVVLYVGTDSLVGVRWGRITLLAGIAVLPLGTTGVSMVKGVEASSQTTFCLSCHEMESYGKTLFADNPKALAAVHYQNRLINRDQTCFSCHTDYALFGDVKAKLNGLRHVWVHYVRGAPERIALYKPYPNHNCLHCHDDARRFLAASIHAPLMTELRAERRSCLSCHNVAHDLAKVKAGEVWQP